ncbi:MAG TPA: class I SAM-dependent methyltransferase [Pirellulales bacterium]|jgi:cyclopropane fatty-acyl-phospholipid synthase-like methyltransferase|nr:class I SAM-dependent methyltransferase [Pirellulales bacterium]
MSVATVPNQTPPGNAPSKFEPLPLEVRDPATVVQCYTVFDKFFPTLGILDYTEGIYAGDPTVPYEVAQQRQIDYVLDEVGCRAGMRILEVGCGNGSLLETVRQRGAEGIGVTISPEQVDLCRRRGLDARLLNYRRLGEEWTGRFDAVVANGPIEHFVQPREAAAGQADAIYGEMFAIFRRMIDPRSENRRLINTTIHFVRTPDPKALLASPWRHPRGSDNWHWAWLARSFGGWYPAMGQFERCAGDAFELIKTADGTEDYHLTSEEWLRRTRRAFRSTAAFKLFARAFPVAVRHPIQTTTMLACMLATESWNWQFRGPQPPTRLLRQTWVLK